MRTTDPFESPKPARVVRLPLGADELAPFRDATAPGARPAGRILRLRLGMNPNSSSVGTNVVTFMWTLSACGAVLGLAGAILAARMTAGPASDASAADEAGATDAAGEGGVAEAAS